MSTSARGVWPMTTCAIRSAAAVLVVAMPMLLANGFALANSAYEKPLDAVTVSSSDGADDWKRLLLVLVPVCEITFAFLEIRSGANP